MKTLRQTWAGMVEVSTLTQKPVAGGDVGENFQIIHRVVNFIPDCQAGQAILETLDIGLVQFFRDWQLYVIHSI